MIVNFPIKCAALSLSKLQCTTVICYLYIGAVNIKKTMARIPATSALVLFLQVTVLILVLSPTANCLSLDDRAQLKQLTDEFVRKTNSIIFHIIHSNFN